MSQIWIDGLAPLVGLFLQSALSIMMGPAQRFGDFVRFRHGSRRMRLDTLVVGVLDRRTVVEHVSRKPALQLLGLLTFCLALFHTLPIVAAQSS